MAATQAQLDELDRLINSGVVVSRFGDRDVTLRSLDDMLRLRAIMQAELDAASSTPRPRQRLAYQGDRGY